jgi:Tol biopolymer transport system component/DNA-binding winged helix-turn-helix (wHTH) protein
LENAVVTNARTAPRSFSFDDFVVDSANRILLRGGVEVPLTARVFDVLLTFLQDPGRLLTKEELIESVWGSEFVEEGNLARNVSTLRKALGDSGKDHRYIVTVQGRGYRFIADVTEADSLNINGRLSNGVNFHGNGSRVSPEEKKRLLRSRAWILPGATALLFLLMAAIAMQFGFFPTRVRTTALTVENVRQIRLTQDGNVYGGTISPDGQYVAYTTIGGSDQGISVMHVSTGTVTPLIHTGPEAKVWGTAFSPDTAFLYFIMKEKSASFADLYRVPVVGGEAKRIANRADGGPSVSPDGGRIAFTRIDRSAGTISVVVTENVGLNETVIDTLTLPAIYNAVEWAPDGRTFLYSIKQQEDKRDVWTVGEMPITGGQKKQIGESYYSRIITARWLGKKSGIIINALDETSRQPQIFFVSYPDGAKRRVTNDLNTYFGVSTSADGRSVVTNATTIGRNIWTVATDKNGKAVRITTGSDRRFGNITWAGSGKLIFDDDEKGGYENFNIWMMGPDGSAAKQLTASGSISYQPHSLADGSKTVFVSRRSGKREIWKMNGDGTDQQPITDIKYDASEPQISSDGRTVYFLADVGGTAQIWKVPLAGGICEKVIDADVHEWALSPDASRIAYTYFDAAGGKLTTSIRSLDGSMQNRAVDIAPETVMVWSIDGRSIFYTTAEDEVRNVWRIDLAGGKPIKVTNFEDQRIYDLALSPEGKTLACVRERITYDAVMLRSD